MLTICQILCTKQFMDGLHLTPTKTIWDTCYTHSQNTKLGLSNLQSWESNLSLTTGLTITRWHLMCLKRTHFFLEWSHVSSLYILEIKSLSEILLANIFSHTIGSLFILLMFSLAVQKLFILISPICLFFPLCPLL